MPAYVELFIDQGSTFNSIITLSDDLTNANINLSSYIVRSKMRRSYYSKNAACSFKCQVTDPLRGQVLMSITSANTANLKPGRYVYDMEIVDSANNVSRVMEGIVFVNPEVTR